MSKPSIAMADMPAEERLLAIAARLTQETHPGHPHRIDLQSDIERDLGLDSLARVELMLRVGREFHAELPTEALTQAGTLRDLLRFLGEASPNKDIEIAPPAADGGCGVPVQAQSLIDALDWHVARQPERTHILLYDDRQNEQAISYGDLFQAASAAAAGLAARGLEPGQAVALMLPTGRDYLAAFFGVMLAGGIPVPIYPPARLAQVADHLKRHAGILSNAGAVLIVTIAQAKPVADMLRAAVPSLAAIVTPEELAVRTPPPRHRPGSADIAFLQYTSGSTGDPKGVTLTHANLLANIRAMGEAIQVAPGDVFVSWLPLYHDMGLISAWLGSLYYAMPLVLMSPLAFLARPARWLEAISRHRGTISGAPNFAYELCVRNIPGDMPAQLDLSSWRLAFNGAEPVNPATLEAFAARFAGCGLRRQSLTPVYGLAECSVGLAVPPPGRGPLVDRIRRDSFIREGKAVPAAEAGHGADAMSIPACGRPLPGHEIRVVDAGGHELPERYVGRLQFRGPSATAGYYRNPEATAKLFDHGWLDSGDYAYLAQGEVYVAGRAKDLIKRGGRNVYPYDLEAAVGNLDGVRKGCVAAFASADPAAGTERLVVLAETRERGEAARAGLRRRINDAVIETIGMPADDIVLVPPHSVLKTSSGKIRRAANRDAYERGEMEKSTAAPWMQKLRFVRSTVAARATLAARQAAIQAWGCYAWTVFIVLALPACGLIAALQRPATGRRIARAAARMLLRLIRLPASAKGLDRLPRRPHVLLVNHASYLDVVLLTALLPPQPGYTYVAKREFVDQPLIRAVLKGLGTLFVERFDPARSAEDLALMAGALARGENLLVFPEGTFRREAGLRPFRMGAFVAAAEANVPTVAAGLRGARAVLREGTWLPRRSAAELEIGPVLTPPGRDWSAAARMRSAARDAMLPLSGEFDLLL